MHFVDTHVFQACTLQASHEEQSKYFTIGDSSPYLASACVLESDGGRDSCQGCA